MKAIGMVEYNNIPSGIYAADAMLKAAEVQLLTAQSVCAGKYIAVVGGDVAPVRASVEAACSVMPGMLVDSMVIPSVDPQVMTAINACSEIEYVGAVGIIETFSLVAAILSADAAVKAANVQLIEIRLGRGLGGKSFVTMTGLVAAVEAAVRAGTAVEEVQGLITSSVVIPSPAKELIGSLL